MAINNIDDIAKHFDDEWYASDTNVFGDNLYSDLLGRIADSNYVAQEDPPLVTNRATLACRDVMEHFQPGAKVLDMACGVGFVTHALNELGYDASGFDVSKEAINRARETATALGQNPDCFSVADQKHMDRLEDNSMDAVLAMGYFRYLDHDDQEALYNSVRRVLKPNGRFILVQQNLLFEAFALNEGMLNFWADLISDVSDVEALLEDKSIDKALAKHLTVPQRKYGSISISRLMYRDRKTPETWTAENPLTYAAKMKPFGFDVEKINYASANLLPPFLEGTVDQDKLNKLKHDLWTNTVDDWRSMFMDYEFLAFCAPR